MTHPIYQSPKDGRELADVQQKVEKLGLGVLEVHLTVTNRDVLWLC